MTIHPKKIQHVTVPVADLFTDTEPLATQLLFGEKFEVLQDNNAENYTGRSLVDSYHAKISKACLDDFSDQPTHKIQQKAAYILAEPTVKAKAIFRLPFMANLAIPDNKATTENFYPVSHAAFGTGWIAAQSICPVADKIADDFVDIAEIFLHTPYLYGGRSDAGIDCSALVQMSLLACNHDNGATIIPRNSGDQAQNLGVKLAATDQGDLQRGDLVFFKGHVAIMRNQDEIIHANASAMCVSIDRLDDFTKRLESSGGGGITAIRRIK